MKGTGGGRWVGFRTACGAIVEACRHRLMFARLLPFTLPCCGPLVRCCGAGRGAALWLEEDDMMRLGRGHALPRCPWWPVLATPTGDSADPLLRYRETDFGPKSSEASVDLPAPTAVGGWRLGSQSARPSAARRQHEQLQSGERRKTEFGSRWAIRAAVRQSSPRSPRGTR